MEQFAIGLDYGTESGRVMLVRLSDGTEAAWSVVPYANGAMDERLPDGTPLGHEWAVQDPDDYIRVLREGIPEVLRQAGAAPEQVAAIGVDFTACTMLPALADSTPLCRLPAFRSNPHAWVKLWKHHAAQPQAVKIEETEARSRTGILRMYNGKYSSEWFFSKVLQIVEEAPEIYAASGRLIEAADWIVWQLTGEERRNECCAGYKDMWVKGSGYASREFFRALHPAMEHVVAEKLSVEMYPLGTRAGGLTAEMAAVTGLNVGTPVAVGVIDAHAAVPACGVTEPGALVMIMGTSLCHMLLGRSQQFINGVAGVVEDGILPGSWGYEAGQAAVGDLYAWFFRTFGMDADEATAKAGILRPGETGLVALDWWNGNRSVLMNADLTGLLIGATLATRPEEIYRALIESTAFGTYTVIQAFENAGVEITRLVACGGLPLKSPLVMQIFADVTNREILLPRSLQASGLGAAMHGAVAAGVFPDFTAAAAQMSGGFVRSFRPDPVAHGVYEELFAEYTALHDHFGRGGSAAMSRLKAIRQRVAK
ncbi:MAG: ribulokinase [Acidobacteria bacterium]|nr:ribulokinase [Acidobacteriota bacterium]